MRKRKVGRKLSRKADQRKALIKALISAVILRGKIKTTEAKAKEISRFCEQLITVAKKGTLASRKRIAEFLHSQVVKILINEVAPKYKDRQGGYTRIIKLGQRKSDGASMAIIELVK